jgi:hypothetical protein
VPRADDQTNIYIWAHEALELLRAVYGSLATAEDVLLDKLKARQIPWTHLHVKPPGTPVDHMWQYVGGSLKPQLAQNEVTFVDVLPSSYGGCGSFAVKVGGIKVERASIMRLLPAEPPAPEPAEPPAPEPAPPAPEPAPASPSKATEAKTAETSSAKAAPKSKLTFKAWLNKVEKDMPRRPRESAVVYAKRLKDAYKDDCRWSVRRMENVLSARKKP